MVGTRQSGERGRPRHAPKKVVTSCLECYRRKQKCDRLRPCNFCSIRGVPELCRYGVNPRHLALDKEQTLSPSDSSKDSHASTVSTSPADLLDQVGYSSVSRRNELEAIGEHHSDSASSNPNNDHATTITEADAYWGHVSGLPSEQLTNALIDAHFSTENWSFPVLDEHHFRNLYRQFQVHLANHVKSMSSILTTFPALLFSVLAVALQFITPDTEEACALNASTVQHCTRISQQYLDTGQRIIGIFERQKPTTTSIEFYLMRTVWLKNCGRGSESWQCLGVALRQAQEIDLHQVQDDMLHDTGASNGDILSQAWELEHQKRLWARIFIMDSHMAVALGRPRGIHREDCSTSAPLDCEYPYNPSQTLPVSANHSRHPPNAFSSIMFSIALSHKYHDLMSMRASRLDLRDYTRVTSLHNDIEGMLTELTPALRPSFPDKSWDSQKPHLPAVRLRILTTANIFLLALHRPYVSMHPTSRDAAMEAAFAILQAQQNLFEIIPQAQHRLYGYSFYTIDAGIFLTAVLLKYPDWGANMDARALYTLQQACARLSCMKDRSLIAETGETVLRRCYRTIAARIPSHIDTTSNDHPANVSSTTEFTTMSLLQEIGFQNPDQATRDLMFQLDESFVDADSLPTDMTVSSDEILYHDIGMSTVDHTAGDAFLYPVFATDDVSDFSGVGVRS